MPQRNIPVSGEIYHIYNRGVDKRTIFLDDSDYLRAMHDLFEFNDQEPAPNLSYHLNGSKEIGFAQRQRKTRKLLVEILAFCLMPNHFHLLVRQLKDRGVTDFMRKFGSGYTNYFNQRYTRSGSLFQGKYKYSHVKTEAQLLHMPMYIHMNPLSLSLPSWREKKIHNAKDAIAYLERYRWSSFLDYVGIKNFPSITQRDFIMKLYGNTDRYKQETQRWLQERTYDDITKLC
ncbi:MAG: transposase [Patescibacteria group bacterium]